MTLSRFVTLRNAHVREVVASYARRPVPMSPGELAAARKQREVKRTWGRIHARVEAVMTLRPLPLEAGIVVGAQVYVSSPEAQVGYALATPPSVTNSRPYSAYLCPDPDCPANRPGHQLYVPARNWGGEKPPACQRCRREMTKFEPGETRQKEDAQ